MRWATKRTSIWLPGDFLSKLPRTESCQRAAEQYAQELWGRMQNVSPRHFYCKSGRPLAIYVDQDGEQACSHAILAVDDLALPQFARCVVDISRLSRDPFCLEEALVNIVRGAVDSRALHFIPDTNGPGEPQRLEVTSAYNASDQASPDQASLEQFLLGKVYWLGFKQGNQVTRVFVADPWDARYLGVEPAELLRISQVLAAKHLVLMEPLPEHVSAADALLRKADVYERLARGSHALQHPINLERSVPPARKHFDVALSFAKSERPYAEVLANLLREQGYAVFYDNFFPDELWGKDLVVHFDNVYRKAAHYCVMFVSQEYLDREWTTLERRSALARMLTERGEEYLLPVRVDDVDVPGLPPTIGYVRLEDGGIERVASLLLRKLKSRKCKRGGASSQKRTSNRAGRK